LVPGSSEKRDYIAVRDSEFGDLLEELWGYCGEKKRSSEKESRASRKGIQLSKKQKDESKRIGEGLKFDGVWLPCP